MVVGVVAGALVDAGVELARQRVAFDPGALAQELVLCFGAFGRVA